MGRNIVRITSNKQKAIAEIKAMNRSFLKENLKRKALLIKISQRYVRNLTRAGYPVPKRNYAIAVKNSGGKK